MDSRQRGSELLGGLMPLALSQYGGHELQIVVAGANCLHGARNVSMQAHCRGTTAVMADLDEDLRRLAYAASDFTLIPSPYERYGMSDTVALLYGSLPVALASGGPGDNLAPLQAEADTGNAFPFRRPRVGEVAEAIEDAMRFYEKPTAVRTAQVERIMKQSARSHRSSGMGKRYVALYEKLLGRDMKDGSARPSLGGGQPVENER
jgi:starch synthase